MLSFSFILPQITILDKWKADARICRLIDYGVEPDVVMQSLEHLNVVRILANPKLPIAKEPAAAR